MNKNIEAWISIFTMKNREKEYCIKVGSIIRGLRKKLTGKSLCIFAYENDIPRSTLSRLERGEGELGLVTLTKVAIGFGCKLPELFKMIDDELGENFTLVDI